MKAIILGYYSSIGVSNIAMLKGLTCRFPQIKKFYLPVFYPTLEKLFLRREKLDKKFETFSFLNIIKLFFLLFFTKKIFFLIGDNLTGSYGRLSKTFTFMTILPLLFFGKKSIILPSTILPSSFNKKILKILLYRAKRVYVREKNAVKKLKRIGIQAFHSQDISTFYLNKISKKLMMIKKRKIIIVAIRNLSPKLIKINKKDFVSILSEQLEQVLEKRPKYRVILLPMQTGIRKKNDDRVILKEIYNSINLEYRNKVTLVEKRLTLDELLKMIRKAELLISSRFHPSLFALYLKTKLIVINESYKIENLAKESKSFIVNKEDLHNLKKIALSVL